MHSDLFSIGNWTVHAYGLFLAVGFIFGLWRMSYIAPKYGFDKNNVFDLGVYILIAGVVGSRLLYVLCNLSEYSVKEAFSLWNGGLSFHGGIALGIIVGAVYSKLKKMNFWKVLDIVSPSVCIGYAFARIGCFLNGCCFGIESSFPWAVKMPVGGEIRLCEPVQLYSCFISILIYFILTKLEFNKEKPGFVFTFYLILYGIYRFLIEYLRQHIPEDYILPYISGGQLLSVVLAVAGIIILCIRFKKEK